MSDQNSNHPLNADGSAESQPPGYSPAEAVTALELFEKNYEELIDIARRLRRQRSRSETLNTTALVHEAFLRLKPDGVFSDEQHFFSSVALAVRHALVDHARKGGQHSTPEAIGDEIVEACDDNSEGPELSREDILAVRQGLEFVAAHDPRLVKVIDYRYFVGLTVEETAITLGMNEKTVRRDWVKARALLRAHLAETQTVLSSGTRAHFMR